MQDDFALLDLSSDDGSNTSPDSIDAETFPLSLDANTSSLDRHGFFMHHGSFRNKHDDYKDFAPPHSFSGPSREKQLEALQHCIALLSLPERPIITSATGVPMQL
eukprot:195517-Hanusia_phi.AAC.4